MLQLEDARCRAQMLSSASRAHKTLQPGHQKLSRDFFRTVYNNLIARPTDHVETVLTLRNLRSLKNQDPNRLTESFHRFSTDGPNKLMVSQQIPNNGAST